MTRNRVLAFLLIPFLLWADSEGPRSGTGAGTGWVNPTRVSSSDNSYATYGIAASDVSDELYISSVGFAIPTGATILGIEVTTERKCSANSACFKSSIALTKSAGVSVGTAKATFTEYWTTSDASETFGNSTDLWGTTWTVAEVNAAGFGTVLVAENDDASIRTASVDYMALTVYYTPSGAASRHRPVVISQTRTLKVNHA